MTELCDVIRYSIKRTTKRPHALDRMHAYTTVQEIVSGIVHSECNKIVCVMYSILDVLDVLYRLRDEGFLINSIKDLAVRGDKTVHIYTRYTDPRNLMGMAIEEVFYEPMSLY